MKIKVFTCVLICSLPFSYCQDVIEQLVCGGSEDCKSCLSAADYCVWCDDYDFIKNKKKPPCFNLGSIEKSDCPKENIVSNKKHQALSMAYNEDMKDFSSLNLEEVYQIQPQKVKLDLKLGLTRTIDFSYRAARNYPLDLYYLMDLTWSMKDDKETIGKLGNALPAALKNLTESFRLGFGSFAEKPLMPYTDMELKHKQNPCITEHDTCLPTYTFAHRLSLTPNIEDFITVVRNSAVTGNLDNTEAGMDALMQVAVCEDRIGWSPMAHRVVILTTDGLLHFAGNGKLGGAVRPTDEICHLDANGDYKDSILFDYPALDQMYRVLREKKISVIFAVTKDKKLHYDKVHDLLPENTFVGSLEEDSSNILNLLNQGYKSLFSSVNFVHNSPDNIKLQFYSNCGKGGPMVETSSCNDIKIGKTYEFTVNITLIDDTPKDGKDLKTSIVISDARQIGKTDLTIDIECHNICHCKPVTSESSKICPEKSKLVCGKCICEQGWYGSNCSCKAGEETSIDFDKCLDPNNPESGHCSKNGDCICGICTCDVGFSGTYCGCTDCQKSLENRAVCGGVTRGVCDCGECKCTEDWSGPTCSCRTGDDHCIATGDTVPCSGRGTCLCGECRCDYKGDGEMYIGKYCQTCASCDDVTCSLYEACARCTLGDKNFCSEGVCATKPGTIFIPTLTEEYIRPSTNLSTCQFWVSEGLNTCRYTYTYQVQKDWTIHLNVSEARGACNTMQMAGAYGIFLATLIFGILIILIMKCINSNRDKEAWKKFTREVEMSKTMGMNPLYKSPITRVTMPMAYDKTKNDK